MRRNNVQKQQVKAKLGHVVQIRYCPFDVNVMLNHSNKAWCHSVVEIQAIYSKLGYSSKGDETST